VLAPDPKKKQNWQVFPNGIVKNRMKFYDEIDENVFEMFYYFELRYQNNSAQL
jgi:hypothetical protein